MQPPITADHDGQNADTPGARGDDVMSMPPALDGIDWSSLSASQITALQGRLKDLARRDLSPRPSYRVSVQQTAPVDLRGHLDTRKTCVLGISLGNKQFEGEKLASIIRWIAGHFDACQVIVGDSVYRLTLDVREPGRYSDSRATALRVGDEWLARHRHLFDAQADCHFHFSRCSEFDGTPRWSELHDNLVALYHDTDSDAGLAELVDGFAEQYLARGEVTDEGRARARAYLLEELAIFGCLVEQGWSLLVYPGAIRTFASIAEGAVPRVSELLGDFAFVSLRLKRRKSAAPTA